MIIAIPINDDRLAPHFTKADSILFVNEQGEQLSRHANPGLNTNCSGKKDLLILLQQQQANLVIVRNIGEQMLGKLLALSLNVLQSPTSNKTIEQLASNASQLIPLQNASQGRPSINHLKKQAEGGCGCTHDEPANSKQGRCCEERHHQGHHHEQKSGRCNDNPGHAHPQHQKGRGRCCHS
ncbi:MULTISPECIES: NifB/NifX family molybdenum-iron cluster-binding protein [unclassified Agarivorans]|uniref:NifB/NifX family molybdenum-iron cluster-binding protein n=1 Tax=unclassified Agarivorans TaxID=2636026 RepID=UPI003D7E8BA1